MGRLKHVIDNGKVCGKMNTNVNKLKEGMEYINKGISVLSSGPMSYYLEKNEAIVNEFFKRCAPFRAGDAVEITIDIDFEKSFGWKSCSHFLRKGDKAVVESIDFYNDLFWAEIKPINQTWINASDGTHHKLNPPHIFTFSENMCRKVPFTAIELFYGSAFASSNNKEEKVYKEEKIEKVEKVENCDTCIAKMTSAIKEMLRQDNEEYAKKTKD